MATKNMKNKTVVFNMNDPIQAEIYEYADNHEKGFSTLVKELLDQHRYTPKTRTVRISSNDEMPRPSIYDVALMKQRSNA